MFRAGKVKVTDVMFPEGSPHLVEPIYKNPNLSAPFNVQLAAAVRTYVEDRLQVPPLKSQREVSPEKLHVFAKRKPEGILCSLSSALRLLQLQ